MITKVEKLSTRIGLIQQIPKMFFRNIENSLVFGNHLFPAWANTLFERTHLQRKFLLVFNKYKAIKTKKSRDRIVAAFDHSNRIKDLCNNSAGSQIIEINDLPKSIRKAIEELFEYLYIKAINYPQFNIYVGDSVNLAIDRFIIKNGIEVCPFCGIEGFINIAGQARLELDHWLCRSLFPMSAVNFNNLFPIGSACNARPAKGSLNILVDNPATKNRIQAYYPYLAHNGLNISFLFINEPTIAGISDADWRFALNPISAADQSIFDSWNSTLNISIRYKDYHRKNIFPMWEADYKRFIEDDHDLRHAQTIVELKANFRIWRASFPLKGRPGAILYRSFIDYLINRAQDPYLYGLCENFKR